MKLTEALKLARDIDERGRVTWDEYQRDTGGKPNPLGRYRSLWKSHLPHDARVVTRDGEAFTVEFTYAATGNDGGSYDAVVEVANRASWLDDYCHLYEYERRL